MRVHEHGTRFNHGHWHHRERTDRRGVHLKCVAVGVWCGAGGPCVLIREIPRYRCETHCEPLVVSVSAYRRGNNQSTSGSGMKRPADEPADDGDPGDAQDDGDDGMIGSVSPF